MGEQVHVETRILPSGDLEIVAVNWRTPVRHRDEQTEDAEPDPRANTFDPREDGPC
jgi:hypothetical protein